MATAALAVLVAIFAVSPAARAQGFETSAEQAILLDANTNSVLFSKNADAPVPPASLAKLMTMEVVFNALSEGRLSLDDTFLVSENAWRTGGAASGGSTMFAEVGSEIRLEDLIQGVIVQSANDGCIIIAEGIAGSEAGFARIMNARAEEIGLRDSVFYNSTGLPHTDQQVTMRDLVRLALHIQRTYPDYYGYYSQQAFTWNGITQRNRNPLLDMDIGADGMKTGFTEESGYAIVGSVADDGRRLVVAMSGLASERQRAEEARKILNWGTRGFEALSLFSAGDPIGAVRLYGGERASVPVSVREDVVLLVPLASQQALRAEIAFDGPVPAPVGRDERIATLRIYVGNQLSQETPLYTDEAVEVGPLHRQAIDALGELVLGWI
ncbi:MULTISPECIES: D-alanyl-D-alanine carboxypeptidase family protein [unclassified Roseitalea]|uniref:D-alanyl-D-alanine carboxypeptidase family protein n=1 Tax=unclassified Roseitalea TaxID=2639107 RepID=UPI00273EE62F|nr:MULTISPECIES: D-alanyl-D-alanine carboxypeptidase family protein [unclassified Roseitalea]